MDNINFCCEGCKQVYLLLNENNLCVYYNFEKAPGIKAKGKFVSGKFAYLDDAEIIQKLIQFTSDTQTNVSFQLPQMHCSSCVFLLENLHRIEPGIIKSITNFQRKEVFIIFDPLKISLRKVVELLAFIGYEPFIRLQDSFEKPTITFNKKELYHIGVAGFCFSNIMMLSFPEYFSAGNIEQAGLKATFAWLNLSLSLPVLFFSASGIFISAWKGMRQKFLNIDVPLALAILVTFGRSYYEIISGQGAGWLDSGTGIVFFMLIGRWFQNKTYDSFSFDRDYKSYFPLGVTKLMNGKEINIPVTQLAKGDCIIIRNEEMVPADAILDQGEANVDYSFVSGESKPVAKKIGDLIYAGGKQCGSSIRMQVVKEASQSYITQLWNNDIFKRKKNIATSFIHPWSKYFTAALFLVAITTGIYWAFVDSSKILPSVTAVLIVACPCSLLLSTTFTYGNMLRIFGKNKLYLKNAGVIESLAKINTIVFDKTGTITQNEFAKVFYEGTTLTNYEIAIIKLATGQSAHPLSRTINNFLSSYHSTEGLTLEYFKEYTGKGLSAVVDGVIVKIGSGNFVNQLSCQTIFDGSGAYIHILLDGVYKGFFIISNQYREGINIAINHLKENKYELLLLSGDNDAEKKIIEKLFASKNNILFNQSPQDKLNTIKKLQDQNKKVLMLGDGLNDAGALMQSDVGIAVSDHSAQFSPACDAIIDGSKIGVIHALLAYARTGKKIVAASFALSIVYNIVGLSFAVKGTLSPIVAAILMPTSSISIVLLVTFLSSLCARGLSKASKNESLSA